MTHLFMYRLALSAGIIISVDHISRGPSSARDTWTKNGSISSSRQTHTAGDEWLYIRIQGAPHACGCRRHTCSGKGWRDWGFEETGLRYHHCSQLLSWREASKDNAKRWKSWRHTRYGLPHDYLFNIYSWSMLIKHVPTWYLLRTTYTYPPIYTCHF